MGKLRSTCRYMHACFSWEHRQRQSHNFTDQANFGYRKSNCKPRNPTFDIILRVPIHSVLKQSPHLLLALCVCIMTTDFGTMLLLLPAHQISNPTSNSWCGNFSPLCTQKNEQARNSLDDEGLSYDSDNGTIESNTQIDGRRFLKIF